MGAAGKAVSSDRAADMTLDYLDKHTALKSESGKLTNLTGVLKRAKAICEDVQKKHNEVDVDNDSAHPASH